MRANRSVPASSVVPVLVYPDVPAASEWLCDAFGFRDLKEAIRSGEAWQNARWKRRLALSQRMPLCEAVRAVGLL